MNETLMNVRLLCDCDGIYDQRLELIKKSEGTFLVVQAGFGDPRGFEGQDYLVKSGVERIRSKLAELAKLTFEESEEMGAFVDPSRDQSEDFKEMFGWDLELRN
jgi:hypothetical protein